MSAKSQELDEDDFKKKTNKSFFGVEEELGLEADNICVFQNTNCLLIC